jgi:hypothetical protein
MVFLARLITKSTLKIMVSRQHPHPIFFILVLAIWILPTPGSQATSKKLVQVTKIKTCLLGNFENHSDEKLGFFNVTKRKKWVCTVANLEKPKKLKVFSLGF